MKKIYRFYLSIFQRIDSPKCFFFSIVLPFALTFCCTLYILCGVTVATMGSKPLICRDSTVLQKGIADEILRLHVVANSDSCKDQQVKLIVKNGLVDYLQDYLADSQTKKESMTIISNHLVNLQTEAERILHSHGFKYPVNVSLGKAMFPIKMYGDITLPAGEYDALRVNLGNACGQNWWCIIFPNLCYVDATYQIVPDISKEKLQQVLTKDEYKSIVSKKETKVVVKFKLFEWLSNLF